MTNHNFEMKMFGTDSICCIPYNSIIICNNNIKNAIINNQLEDFEVKEPYIIMTNNTFNDEQIEILEDASIADYLSWFKIHPSFGGILI